MSDSISAARADRLRRQGRLASYALSVLIGPPLAGCFVFFLLNFMNSPTAWFNPQHKFFDLVLFAILNGTPSALVAGPIGIWYFRKSLFVPLWGFLAVAFIAVVIMISWPLFVGMLTTESLFAGMIALFPALLSSVVCWYATKRWHSPNSTP